MNVERKEDSFTRRNSLVEANLHIARRAARWAAMRLPANIEFDDIFQSAVLGLIEAADHYDPKFGTPFDVYARKRVFGAAIDPFRGGKYRDHTALFVSASGPIVLPCSDPKIAARQLHALVARALPALSSKERTVIVLRYWDGKDFEQIARQLRVALSRTYKLHTDALDELSREFRRTIHCVVQGPGVIGRLLLSV